PILHRLESRCLIDFLPNFRRYRQKKAVRRTRGSPDCWSYEANGARSSLFKRGVERFATLNGRHAPIDGLVDRLVQEVDGTIAEQEIRPCLMVATEVAHAVTVGWRGGGVVGRTQGDGRLAIQDSGGRRQAEALDIQVDQGLRDGVLVHLLEGTTEDAT